MNNYIDENGLHTQTVTDIVTTLEDGFKSIYGSDINLNVNSPDAQMINLFAQALIDSIDCMVQVYNSFNPDLAMGSVLDQRVNINGIQRKGASYTRTYVSVTTDRSLTILGLDTSPSSPFTVQDQSGNKFSLLVTASLLAGTSNLEFISNTAGQIETIPNTIKTISTSQVGVTAVNNPTSAIVTGTNQESDAALRLRRKQSITIASQSFLEGLTASILEIENVVDCVIYENSLSIYDSIKVMDANSVWVVVDGGSSDEIAETIYRKKSAGCAMKGSQNVSLLQINGIQALIKFDRPVYQNLYIKIFVTSKLSGHIIDPDSIKNFLFEKLSYKIYQAADFTEITSLVKQSDEYAVITSGGVGKTSDMFFSYVYPTSYAGRFLVSLSNITVVAA